jgi:cytochrome c553
MKRWLCAGLILGLAAAGLSAEPAARGSVPADGELRREVLERKLDSLARNEDRFRRYILEGELRTSLCRHCHGAEGVSRRPGVPSLAAQDPAYLVEQFERFADGEREEFVMSGLADGLGESDMIRLALYYASLPLGPEADVEPHLADRGAPIYRRLCTDCHGADGRGGDGYARLAGQRADYTAKMLRQFQQAGRHHPLMSRVAVGLSDRDIEALAAYTAKLP